MVLIQFHMQMLDIVNVLNIKASLAKFFNGFNTSSVFLFL